MTKVLVITYYWPPAGGPGVQRWLSFTKYLPENDIQPVVFTAENADYPLIDQSLVAEVPDHVIVHKLKIKEPYGFARLFLGKKAKVMSSGILKESGHSLMERIALWVRGNFFIPDARRSWVKPAVQKISELIQEDDIKTVITTGPPHSVHLIGLNLKRQFDLKWIADFRDPWTSIGYHSQLKLSRSAQRKHKNLESTVLNTADKIITTSHITAAEFAGLTSKPITVITNGFDTLTGGGGYKLDRKFSLSFIGSLLSKRNPVNLWRSLAEILKENKSFREQLQINLIGVVSEQVFSTIKDTGLGDFTQLVPYVEHKKAIELQRRSQVLLLIEIDSEETRGIIPGKLFEYLAARRPILAIGPEHWEAGKMVRETGSGSYFLYKDQDAIKSQILQWFNQFESGELKVQDISIEKYSRRALSNDLATEIRWE